MSARFVRYPGCIGLISLVLSLAAAPVWPANALPEMGNSVDEVLSPADEARLGREVIQQLRGMNALLDDPLIDRYLQSLGQRLVSQSSAAGDPFLFFAVRDGRVNAFALPGGYVGVNTGLIVLTRSESELAGVLAHEVSHVAQRHIARRMADSRQANILTGAATLAAILAGARANSLFAHQAHAVAARLLVLDRIGPESQPGVAVFIVDYAGGDGHALRRDGSGAVGIGLGDPRKSGRRVEGGAARAAAGECGGDSQ